jgi:polyphosphate kinase
MSETAPSRAALTGPKPVLLNRERAILEFNRRVLAQAGRDDVPLLERLRYVCIVSSNLDEFFEVRIADLVEAAKRPGLPTSARDLDAIAVEAHALVDSQYRVFNDVVMPLLAREGIVVLSHAERTPAQQRWVSASSRRRSGRSSCRSASTRRIRSRRSRTSR